MLKTPLLPRDESGSVLTAAVLIAFIMLITVAAVCQFGAQDASLAKATTEKSRALYAAEAGLARGLGWLEAQPSPPAGVADVHPFGAHPDTLEGGSTYAVTIRPHASNGAGTMKRYTIISSGTVGARTRTLSREVMTQSFAQYIYFTEDEHLPNSSTPVWFCSADYIDGTAHTNGQLNIFGDPTFGGHVSSAHGGPDDPDPNNDPSFLYYNGSFWNHLESAEPSNAPYDEPAFEDGYELGASAIELPQYLDDLQAIATDGGVYLSGSYQIKLAREVHGEPMVGYVSYRQPGGRWTDVEISSFNGVLYVTGDVQIQGVLDGTLTVASGGDTYVLGDVVYHDADPVEGPNDGCDDVLGLVSQENVIIDNNTANSNGVNIHAHVMALGTSFTAENYNSGSPRGTLTVHGGIIQQFRGAVGTGTIQGDQVVIRTGYAKNYHYDQRFSSMQPPGYFLTGMYEKLSWREIEAA
jgi:hypothetical protein